jgi:hypothetical protein
MPASDPHAAAASAHAVMMRMGSGFWLSQCIHVAARLGLADLLKDGPRPIADLAADTDTHAPSLYRMLRGLASVGVFAEDAQGRFGLTPLAEVLRSDVPGSMRAAAVMMGDEHYRAWGDFLACVRTGQTAFDRVFGKPVFDYLAEHPEAARVFDAAMVSVHGAETAAMLDAYDFRGVGTLVDVGGGNGSLLIETLRRHGQMRGVLYDRPDVVERARAYLEAAGLTERCTAVGGNFFESIPPGGDAYLMRHIIHDWDDEKSLTILKNCRKVIGQTGRLLVVESVIAPGNGPDFAKLLDLNMLVVPGGKERTEAEYRALYAAAGFRLARVVPTRAGVGVIEGLPA